MSRHEQKLRQLATDLFTDHARDAEELDDDYLREVLTDDEGVPAEDLPAAVERTRHLLGTAVITVTWPDEPAADNRAEDAG